MSKIEIDKAQAEDMLHTFELLASSIGKPTNEYHWRSFLGHIKALEDAGADNVVKLKMMRTCTCGSTDVETRETFKRTGKPKNAPKEHKFRRVSYGYRFEEHTCNKCGNTWEGKKI